MVQQGMQVGDPFGFLHAGQAWGREFAGPWVSLWHAGELLITGLPDIAYSVVLDVTAIVVVGGLLVLLWRGSRRGVWPLEAAIVTTLLWVIPICSQLVASQARYMLSCWPVLLVVAGAWSRLPSAVRVALLAVPAAATVVLLRRLSNGSFTG
jgi:hypothetical protein